MLDRSIARTALLAVAVALLVTTGALAAKPAGFPTYKQCVSKTNCSARAYSGTNGATLQLTFLKVKCPIVQAVLNGSAGALHPNHKTGKFSATKTAQVQSATDGQAYDVHVKLTGTARFKKSVSGSYKVTTKAPECSAASQKATKFKLKYAGQAYGG